MCVEEFFERNVSLMTCPKCGGKVRVVKTENYVAKNEIYRQQICFNCGRSFYTVEFDVEETPEFKILWNAVHKDNVRRSEQK